MDIALKPLTDEAKVRRIVTWDIETDKATMEPFLVGIRYGEGQGQGIQFQGSDCIGRVLDWMLEDSERNPDTSYYAHNGGGFDHQFAIYEAIVKRAGRYRVKPIISGGSTILVHFLERSTDRELMLYDSLRLFIAQSLKSIGECMGVAKKGEMDLDAPPSDPRWLEYNDRDCLVLWQAVTKLQGAILELGGSLRATAASTAMDLFRRRYLKMEIAPLRQLDSFLRKVYVGGRTEPFRVGVVKGPLNYYDVNSLYPRACLEPLPVELIERGNYARNVGLPKYDPKTEALFANALVHVPESCRIPPLPRKGNGKLLFPVGTFWGTWTTPDLENLLLSGGQVLRTHRFYRFRCEPIARQMMLDLYALRKSERPEMQVAAKGLMNSWYGKFGQKPERSTHIFNPGPGDCDEGTWELANEEFDMWSGTKEEFQVHMLPQIAAHVTSVARRIHYGFLLQCPNAVYCDTDSIITHDTLPTGPGLGEMKLEYQLSEFCAVAPKTYYARTVDGVQIDHAKGFGGWNKEVFEDGVVQHLIKGGTVRVRGPMKLLGLLKSGNLKPREKVGKDGLLGQAKRFKSTFDKRLVNDDGSTSPIVLDESESQ